MGIIQRVRYEVKKFLNFYVGRQNYCRIAEINVAAQQVTFHVKKKSLFLKYTFSEAVCDMGIIQSLSPVEACWLGGYFGRAFRACEAGRPILKRVKNGSFLLSSKRGRYKVVFENRTGEVGYFDKKSKKEFVEHPLTIANNPYLIAEFDSSQACYIGILAGASMEKMIEQDKKTGKDRLGILLQKRPKLRVVK
jgi:hypothetical protein